MAKRVDIRIDQGATWSTVVQVNNADGSPRNLTGYTAAMHIRTAYGVPTALVELLSPSDGITINALVGQITVTIPAVETAALTTQPGVYDLKITSGAVVERLIEGSVGVFPQVTV